MRKIMIIRIAAPVSALLLFFSCASSPETPKWIERHPSDDKYYIGIGFSDDSVQSVAASKARQEALANLASSISTSIVTETETVFSETVEGEVLQSMHRRIREQVDQTIEGAEVVDSFYSLRHGYWIYLRISKRQLEHQKRELQQRIEELLLPVYHGETGSTAEALSLLQKGHELLLDSPFFTSLSGEMGEARGNLLDLIEGKTASRLSSLRISVSPDTIEGTAGESAEAVITVQGDVPAGRLPVILRFGDEVLTSGSTNDEGNYTMKIDLSRIPLGRTTLSAGLRPESLNIRQEDYFLNLRIPEADFPVNVKPLPLVFSFEYDDTINVPGIKDMASALFFSSGLPFSLAEQTDTSEYLLRCKLIVEDFPRYRDNSLEISQARLIIQVESGDQILHTYESGTMKDGGLTIDQAHERAVKKLFQKLKSEQAYLPGLISALPIRVSR